MYERDHLGVQLPKVGHNFTQVELSAKLDKQDSLMKFFLRVYRRNTMGVIKTLSPILFVSRHMIRLKHPKV